MKSCDTIATILSTMRHFFIATLFVVALALGAAVTHYYHLNGGDISVYTMNLPESEGDKDASKLTYGPSSSLANADFFEDVKKKFIDSSSNFIEADLSRMKLTVYQGGVPVKEVPVLTKGREGLWWQTPAGLYKIESKAKSHYS